MRRKTYAYISNPDTGDERKVFVGDADSYNTLEKMLRIIGVMPDMSTIRWSSEPFMPQCNDFWGFELSKIHNSVVSLYAICGRRYVSIDVKDLTKHFRRGL